MFISHYITKTEIHRMTIGTISEFTASFVMKLSKVVTKGRGIYGDIKDQKNHYNVKLLRVYCSSISLKANKVCLKGWKGVFTGEQEIEEWFVTQIPYERIVLCGIRTGNRYASDVINALLNYGYSVLAAEIAKFVHGRELDPYFVFFHKTDTPFQVSVCDLIEPNRWLVEFAVYKLAVEESKHGRSIRKEDYAHTRDGRVILETNLIRRFLNPLKGNSSPKDHTRSSTD